LSDKEIVFVGENQLIASCLLIIMDYLIDRNSHGAVINVAINKKGQGVEVIYSDSAGPLSEAQIASQFDLFSSLAHSIGFAKMIAEIHQGKLVISNDEYKGIQIHLGFYTNN
jgi:hypothetical protein